ncbi:hypothetical protein HOG16_03900, partial [Candidatus Woesearchaeota archaeon]|nr:hypothetical protein [Candidatus Woesearchaeota archaeon]
MAVEYLDYDGNEFVEGFYHGLKGVEDICYVSKVDEGWDCINLDGSSFVLNSGNNKASRCFIRVPDVERLEAETWFDIDGLREKADKLEKVMRFVGRGGRSGEDSGERGDEGSGYRCGDVGKD